MAEYQLGVSEARFADIIWSMAPVASGVLAKEAEKAFEWKKTTTYTVLKRLCNKGLFENDGGVVRVLVSKEQFYGEQSKRFVAETFGGSLPAFLAAFTSGKKLDNEEVEELRRLVDSFGEE